MSLIVEDGTGLANAESYISVADTDTYHSLRGNDAWALLSTADKEESLRRATDYMESVYRLRWLGWRAHETQALSWPREEVPRKDFSFFNQYSYYANNIVPTEVKNACAALALKASAGELAPDIDRLTTREKVGPIEVEYSAGGVPYVQYREIDSLLAPFFKSGGSNAQLVRV